MKILLLGASGLVGKNVLAQALAHPAITSVVAPTRLPLAPHSKLTNPVSDRLVSLLPEGVARGVDAVVCALGTTIGKAGSKEAFREVDYVLPLDFARSAHELGTETFVLVSASVASVSSPFFYPRIKGEIERDIELVGFKSRTAFQGGHRSAIHEHTCADSPKEVSYQSRSHHRCRKLECCHDGRAGPPFSFCRKPGLTGW
jgi:uncharacterized protein YbjT (DUF2867 family)